MTVAQSPRTLFTAALLLAVIAAGCRQPPDERAGQAGMDSEEMSESPMQEKQATGEMAMAPDSLQRMKLAPLVKGYYDDGELYFIHTETSDPDVAEMLTEMMGPRVEVTPQLAEVPESILADIYVFENGIEGMGPFGHQLDVFAAVPGDEAYSPLHSVQLVSWTDDATPRELRSAEEVQEAAAQGELSIEEPDIVINAPVLAWPGGHR